MKISQVFLIGLGGTGSLLAEPLTRLIAFHKNALEAGIMFLDGDQYSEENKERQIFSEEAVGRYKAKHTYDRLRFLKKGKITNWITYVNGEKILALIEQVKREGVVLVIATVDNHDSRKSIIEGLKNCEKSWLFISPGNNLSKGQVSIYGIINNREIGTNPLLLYPDMNNPTDRIPKMYKSCVEEAVSEPQLIGTNLLAATSVFTIVSNLLEGNDVVDELHFDLVKMKMIPGSKVEIIE